MFLEILSCVIFTIIIMSIVVFVGKNYNCECHCDEILEEEKENKELMSKFNLSKRDKKLFKTVTYIKRTNIKNSPHCREYYIIDNFRDIENHKEIIFKKFDNDRVKEIINFYGRLDKFHEIVDLKSLYFCDNSNFIIGIVSKQGKYIGITSL